MSDFITPQAAARSLAKEPIERWSSWLVLVLQELEVQAADLDPDHPEQVELLCFEALRDALDDRLDNRRW
jgi:hypothetical protein